MNSAMVSLNRLWMSSMLPMFAICKSSRIFSRRAFSSGVRFFLAMCNTSCLLLLFYTSQQVYTNYGIVSLRKTVGTGCFHQAVDHSTGLGSFYCITEQPVLASHSKGTDGILSKVIRNPASGVKQVVLHVGLLFAGVLHSLFQISSQRLLFQLFQPAPKSPEHGFLHRKALFLSFFGWQ